MGQNSSSQRAGQEGPHPLGGRRGAFPADHGAAESTSSLPVLDPHGAMDREAAVAPREQVADDLLSDQLLEATRPPRAGLSARPSDPVTRRLEGAACRNSCRQSGQRTRATLTPGMALKDVQPYLSFAVQGGDTQDQNLLQFFLNVVEFGMNVQQAVEAANITS